MNTTLTNFLIVLLLSLISCSGDEDEIIKQQSGTPDWAAGYPHVAHGAVSVDVNVLTSKSAKVYYVLSTKSLNTSAAKIRELALSPTDPAIRSAGVIESSSASESRKTILQLSQRTRYFMYLIAQNVGDTLYQKEVSVKEFVTYARQDTSEFTSGAENRKVKYLIYRPEEALKYPDKKYPMCYFLGGNGEVATNDKPVNMIRNGSLPEYLYKGNDIPMMVMSIQHNTKDWNVNMIDEGITHGNKTYPVDPAKVYLTGISGGGYGCWNYALTFPEKLTAIVPISGGGNNSKACNLKQLPIWAFHNQTDNIVPSSNTINMIKAVNACPSNKEVKQLIFPDSGHDCWRRVYDKNHANWSKSPGVEKVDIYSWLLSKTKP